MTIQDIITKSIQSRLNKRLILYRSYSLVSNNDEIFHWNLIDRQSWKKVYYSINATTNKLTIVESLTRSCETHFSINKFGTFYAESLAGGEKTFNHDYEDPKFDINKIIDVIFEKSVPPITIYLMNIVTISLILGFIYAVISLLVN